jgi:hypothetical protein
MLSTQDCASAPGIQAGTESGASGAALGENGESRAHYAADSGFGDAREMLGENATISKNCRFVCPIDAQEPATVGFFGLRRCNFIDGNFQKGLETRVAHGNLFGADEELRGK